MRFFYYGAECPHCHDMMPIVDKLIAEGVTIEKKETWHNDQNANEVKKVDGGKCGGVPFFWNDETKEWICGATTQERVRAWAKGK